MQLSLDGLLGNRSEIKPVSLQPSPPACEVEIKKNNIKHIDKTDQLHEKDIELLESIASILIDRRSRMMEKLLHAINKVDQSKENNKENSMAIPSVKRYESRISFDEDIFEDDDDNSEDDLEDDDDFGDDDDFFDDDDDDDDDDEEDDFDED
jgi:hypothetical protein